MISSLVKKAGGYLMDPVGTFEKSAGDSVADISVYFIALLMVNAALSAVLTAAMISIMPALAIMAWGIPSYVAVFFIVLVAGGIGTLVFGIWLHIWVLIFGGREGIFQTMKSVVYASTPRLLLGWLPLIGFLFTLWSLFLVILGIRDLQKLDSLKAILAVALAVMIPVILLIVLAAYFMVGSVTTTAVPVASPL